MGLPRLQTRGEDNLLSHRGPHPLLPPRLRPWWVGHSCPSSFKHSRWDRHSCLSPSSLPTFACHKCHRIQSFFNTTHIGWNLPISHLAAGLLFGHEVTPPLRFKPG